MKLTGKDLTNTQKAASLGILVSGIAHELGTATVNGKKPSRQNKEKPPGK